MKSNRRKFLSTALLSGMAAATPISGYSKTQTTKMDPCLESQNPRYAKLDEVLRQPVFKNELFSSPVIIESVELLRNGNKFLCRVRSKDGAEGISVAHGMMNTFYPVFVKHLQQMFIGLDARRLDEIVEKALIYGMNYRYQPLPWHY